MVKRQRTCFQLISLCSLAVVLPARADSFWCGFHLIREGMATISVLKRCGPPQFVESLQQPVLGWRPNGTVFQAGVEATEYWTYDRGHARFPVRVTIEKGTATRIDLLMQ